MDGRRREPRQEEDGRTEEEGEEAGEKREKGGFILERRGVWCGVFYFFSLLSFFRPLSLLQPRLPLLEYLCPTQEPVDVELDGCFKRHRRQCLLYL